MQPFHYLLRMTHVVSAAAFFGGIVLFDLRLAGVSTHAKLKPFAQDTLWWLYVTSGRHERVPTFRLRRLSA